MAALRQARVPDWRKAPGTKRRVKYLFVEADEDHVPRDGIRAWRRYEGIWQGCSAEGHVSHVYAARLSSRPMAWSRVGVQTMAQLRVWQANGGSARAAYLHGKPQPPLKVSSRWLQRLREEVEPGRLLPAETPGNLPALRGHRTALTRALRALSQFTAVLPGPTVRAGMYPPPCDSGLTPSNPVM